MTRLADAARAPAARWDALGTYAFLATSDPARLEPAQALARAVLADVDRTCSRFRADADLVRANARPGAWVPVDPLLVHAVRVAVEAAEATDGLVDPCLGRALVTLGYDADLAEVRARRRPAPYPPPQPAAPPPRAWRRIGLDPDGALRVPTGCALDLGATAKAWASDLVAATVVERLGCAVVVSLGGDVRALAPDGADHPGWPVRVTERPEQDGDAEDVRLDRGGLATSSTTTRRWWSGGREQHHLLDPRTGLPVRGRWRTATATGPSAVAANTASTAALVADDAAAWLAARSVTARLVANDGTVTRLGGWPAPTPTPDEARRTA
ncbi:MAG: FAD:protein FMN transferase [Nocardioidaceae bacterium]